jgi:hypothetical protein
MAKKNKEEKEYKVPKFIYKGSPAQSSLLTNLFIKASPQQRRELFKESQKLFKKQEKAEAQKKIKRLILAKQFEKAPIRTSLQQIGTQEQLAQKRQRRFSAMTSRAEQLEIQAVNFDEVPMLRSMESQRTRLTSPPNKSLIRIEKEVTDSFPD